MNFPELEFSQSHAPLGPCLPHLAQASPKGRVQGMFVEEMINAGPLAEGRVSGCW